MKRYSISTFGAFLLIATGMLLPSAIDAKKLKWKTITPNKSGIVLDVDGYDFKKQGTGWNDSYSHQKFRSWAYGYDKPLYIALYSSVLAPNFIWSNTNKNIERNIRTGSRFKNSIVRFIKKSGASKDGSFDSDQKESAAKFEIAHSILSTCYFINYVPHFGELASFNPSLMLEICSKGDLNLSIDNPEKFFVIDDRNEKVGLDFSYQNLGQKIAALGKQLSESTDETVTKSQSKVGTTNTPSLGAATDTAKGGSITDRLKSLKKLEDAGLISKEEAAAKRKEILKNL